MLGSMSVNSVSRISRMAPIVTESPTMNRVEWDGAFFDGVTPSSQPVKLRVLSDELQVWTSMGDMRSWPYEQLRQTQGFYAGQQIRLETGGSPIQALAIADNEFLDAVHHIAGSRSGHFHRRDQRSWRIPFLVFAAFSIIGIGFWFYSNGVPSLANFLSQQVPVSWEERIGKT